MRGGNNWNEGHGEMKRRRRKSQERAWSPRDTIGLDGGREEGSGAVLDKWPVYRAFTANEAESEDASSPLYLPLCPSL